MPLERALTLAEPEGYVRVFVDEGPPMTALLRGGREHGIARGVRRAGCSPRRAQPMEPAPQRSRDWSTR